jgi:RNA polymerase sigma-70 factor (ECF subfamily)
LPEGASTHVDLYHALRPELFSYIYRMLGEVHEAEDILQEVWLEWQKQRLGQVENPQALLKTIAMRRAIDSLRRRSRRKEEYIGPWLPEPFESSMNEVMGEPSPHVLRERADELSIGFLVLLESLSASERAVYILKSAFDYKYAEIALELDLTVDYCRKIYSRAKQKLRQARPKPSVSRKDHQHYLREFQAAIEAGAVDKFARFLASDVVLYSDGGGKAVAALRPIYDADKVQRLLAGLAKKWQKREPKFQFVELNYSPALLWFDGDALQTVVIMEANDTGIDRIYMIRNPDKISHLSSL